MAFSESIIICERTPKPRVGYLAITVVSELRILWLIETVLESSYFWYALSLLAISLLIAGGVAIAVLLYYEGTDGGRNDSTGEQRRAVLRYASVAGLSGLIGAAGGGLSLLTAFRSGDEGERPPLPDGVTGLLLTWRRDPTTTMTVDWHTVSGRPSEARLRFRRDGNESWQEIEGETRPFPATTDRDGIDERSIHRVELTDLNPGTEYRFQFAGYDSEYRFRTMPAEISRDRPLRFATGGDTSSDPEPLRRVNEVAMEYDLDFIQWGGDFAYIDADPEQVTDWFDWFAVNKETLVSGDGRVVPIIVAIGNHELVDGREYYDQLNYTQTDEHRRFVAPFFYDLFAFPGQPGYGTLDFGDYLSFVILDSACSNPIVGEQTRWLEETLAARTDRPYLFTSYHHTAFPSHKDWDRQEKEELRAHWVPLFEEYEITVALEHDDHTYKRSVPIRDGTVAEDGIRYVGDGAWGVSPREGDNRDAWYIDVFESDRHAIVVELDGSTAEFEVLNEGGRTIDEFSLDSRASHDRVPLREGRP
ncbi:purple acid phosphatase family protein [Natronorarus salvus]|uniref:purple acid phosphatase family protein n=1 Tax=Natronorarus salvus TaxID=3117733 RepID=UPI002F2670E3